MIGENRAAVLERMSNACVRAGRAENSVRLLAVSKRQTIETIKAAYQAGQRDFGENYGQELREKAAVLRLPEIRWHSIGRLQVNKVKYVANAAWACHAIDRIEVARELSRRAPGTVKCFLEVDVAGEETKAGVSFEDIPAMLEKVSALDRLEVVGLMCLPPYAITSEASRPYFARMQALATKLQLPELSMGTTQDFEVAVEEGATWVRVGSELFGARPKAI